MESGTPRRTKRQDSLHLEFLLPSPSSLLSPPVCVSLELLSCGRQSSISEPPYIMDRARVLLKLVIMPLVPQNPKNWSGVTPFPIQFYGDLAALCLGDFNPEAEASIMGICCCWRPMMSFLAMSLSSRSFLLTKYNFLWLPGSGKSTACVQLQRLEL